MPIISYSILVVGDVELPLPWCGISRVWVLRRVISPGFAAAQSRLSTGAVEILAASSGILPR